MDMVLWLIQKHIASAARPEPQKSYDWHKKKIFIVDTHRQYWQENRLIIQKP